MEPTILPWYKIVKFTDWWSVHTENERFSIQVSFTSVSKRVLAHSVSYGKDSIARSLSYTSNLFPLCTGIRFETEIKGNSEMAYWLRYLFLHI